ncbi:hypothetical protein [Myxosarcina sp. GI1(2024)]
MELQILTVNVASYLLFSISQTNAKVPETQSLTLQATTFTLKPLLKPPLLTLSHYLPSSETQSLTLQATTWPFKPLLLTNLLLYSSFLSLSYLVFKKVVA